MHIDRYFYRKQIKVELNMLTDRIIFSTRWLNIRKRYQYNIRQNEKSIYYQGILIVF